jgi:8-oxo-dGTP pyrophosphatase MutT (NUDIX family)|tara:strand:- start:8731 stop:9147 length:417 start_codon:yes stop_codon:yes gene_type:complete
VPALIETANWVLRDGDRILSVRSHGRDRFYMPGGKIDPGETAIAALIREIKEELGVALIPETICKIGVFSGPAHDQADETMVCMACFSAAYRGTLAPAREIAEMRWISLKDRHLMAPMGQKIAARLPALDATSPQASQ